MAYSFTSNDDFNFRIQTMLGGVYYGLGDVGEILATVSKVPDGDDRAWAKQFGELAERVERSAKESKDPRSSAEAHLRAAVYFAARQDAEVTYASDEVILRTFHNHRRCWDAFAEAVGLEQVSIPYPEQPMPGYFAAAGTGPAPTVVIINGSDGALTWVWTLARAGSGPWLQRLDVRRPRSAVDALRAQDPLPPGLGGRDHASCRSASQPA